jgi:hypothetical protein
MTIRTTSELLFEDFCRKNSLLWERIPEGQEKTPDYTLTFGACTVAAEIKQLDSLKGFNPGGYSSRVPGDHVRRCIDKKRDQIQAAAKLRMPAMLLIYNNVDPWQYFSTEPHDFLCAMYGELTFSVSDGKLGPYFHGNNSKTSHDANTSFSAIGHLIEVQGSARIVLYQNAYAANPLPFDNLPGCFEMRKVEIER